MSQIESIYKKYYDREFEIPDFLSNEYESFAITDMNGRVISAGGVRSIAEVVIVTDKDYPIDDRRDALYYVLETSSLIAKKAGYRNLHAVSENDIWLRHLMQAGFHSRGKILALNL